MEQKEQSELSPVFSVSEYIEFLNIGLKKFGVAKIFGEVSSEIGRASCRERV